MMLRTFKWNLLVTSLLLSGAIAIAQPGNPPPGNPPPPRGQNDNRRMTPEERRKQSEDKLRDMMSHNGVTDASTQDAVLAFLSNELETRRPLRQLAVKLQRALADQNISDNQIKAMIADYQNAQDLQQQNRAKAQSDLDAKIHYSQNPRLQGILMLMGVLGDGPPLMEGPRRPDQRGDNKRPNQNGAGRGTPEMRKKMLEMFDKDGDGKLNKDERAAMQAYNQQRRQDRQNNNRTQPPNNQGDRMDNDN